MTNFDYDFGKVPYTKEELVERFEKIMDACDHLLHNAFDSYQIIKREGRQIDYNFIRTADERVLGELYSILEMLNISNSGYREASDVSDLLNDIKHYLANWHSRMLLDNYSPGRDEHD